MEKKYLIIVLSAWALILILVALISYNVGVKEGVSFENWKADQYDVCVNSSLNAYASIVKGSKPTYSLMPNITLHTE